MQARKKLEHPHYSIGPYVMIIVRKYKYGRIEDAAELTSTVRMYVSNVIFSTLPTMSIRFDWLISNHARKVALI